MEEIFEKTLVDNHIPLVGGKETILPVSDVAYHSIVERFNEADLSSLSDDELLAFYGEVQTAIKTLDSFQLTQKVLLSKLYGACGNPHYIYVNSALASDVCAEGRFLVQTMDRVINEYAQGQWMKDDSLHKKIWERGVLANPNDKESRLPSDKSLGELLGLNREPKPIPSSADLCVYADTDSNYIEFGHFFTSYGFDVTKPQSDEMLKWCTDFVLCITFYRLNDLFNDTLDEIMDRRNAKNKHFFEIELVGHFGIFITKKKYVISKCWTEGVYNIGENKKKYTGIDLAKKGTNKVILDEMARIVDFYMNDPSVSFEKLNNEVKASVRSIMATVKEEGNNELLCKKGKCNTYDKYVISFDEPSGIKFKQYFNKKGSPIPVPNSVKAAANYNRLVFKRGLSQKYPYIKNGEAIYSYYTTIPNKKDGFISFGYPAHIDFPSEFAPPVNRKVQIEKLLYSQLITIVESKYGIKYTENNFGKKQIQRKFF